MALVKGHFNIVTPENCMNPGPVHPSEDNWSFARPDALVNWCAENGHAVHGHTLVWHSQTNNWFFQSGDRAVVTKRLKDHISMLVGRYKGKIRGWDVVNEAINDGGNAETGQTENLRNSQWLRTMGSEFLTLAFKFAHEADPDAKLYYIDYNIEAGQKHASSMVLLKRLIKDCAPIYGVGIQGHWSTATVPYAAIDKAIADYAALGLKVRITELDVTIRGAAGGQFGGGGRRGGVPAAFAGRSQDPSERLCKVVRDLHQTQGHLGTRYVLGPQRPPVVASGTESADFRRQQPAEAGPFGHR
jgi:GH35 family endo-1,4-beta-xylanase